MTHIMEGMLLKFQLTCWCRGAVCDLGSGHVQETRRYKRNFLVLDFVYTPSEFGRKMQLIFSASLFPFFFFD